MSALVNQTNVHGIVTLLSQLPKGSPIAIDCETTGLHPYQGDTLRGFSFAFPDPTAAEGSLPNVLSYYVPVGYPEGNLSTGHIQLLCGAIEAVQPVLVFHHAKFDLRFLRQLPRRPDGGVYFAVPPPGRLMDTKVIAWLMDENLSTSLQFQAHLHLGEGKSDYMRDLVMEKGRAALKEEGVKRPKNAESLDRGWALVTAAETAEYGAKDAELTLRLYWEQANILWGSLNHPTLHGHPGPAVQREMAVQGLLLRMEEQGIMVDSGYLEELLENAEIECQAIEVDFMDAYSVNVNSPKQVAELLYDILELPGPASRSVARGVLERLEGGSVVVRRILTHRRLRKAISSYLIPLKARVADDDRVHPTFWSMGTVTGRFSCSDPNLQTIPRGDTLVGVRDVFVATPGFELWEYDLEAAEMRVVAGMAKEGVLIVGLNTGTDMHAALATKVFGPNYTPLQRRQSKNLGYGFFYGLISPTTAAKYIDGPNGEATAKKILAGLKELYPNVVKLMKTAQRSAEKNGYVTIAPGRHRRFVTEAAKKPYSYTALNAMVQGGIGEFMKDVMLSAEERLDMVGARICLQVHDSLVVEVPIGMGDKVREILQVVADQCNPFAMQMIFDGKEWGDHE